MMVLLNGERTASDIKRQELSQCKGIFSIFTHMTERERILLFQLAYDLQPNAAIVEVGSYLGASTCFLAAAARSTGSKVYAVDTWKNQAMSEGSRDTYQEFITNTASLRGHIIPLRGLSCEIAARFTEKVDLLFIDGDHSYEAVLADLQAWLPKLKPNGLVVFHDYSWAEGVRKAVRELVLPLQVEHGHRLDSIYWTRVSDTSPCQKGPRTSVIVPTYGRPEHLNDLLEALASQDPSPGEFEIIVVDNNPTGVVHEIVDALCSKTQLSIRYIEESRTGLHNARHAGAKAAQGEILVYVDGDILPQAGWLKAMLESFTDPAVAVVDGKILPQWDADPPEWLSQFHPSYLSLLDLGKERRELKWPDGGIGCNMAIRRSALYELGGFNPDAVGDDRRLLWLGGDGETGLHQKVYQAGYKVIYEPRACVFHRVPAHRVGANYLYRRSFARGISDSYSVLREGSNTKTPRILLLRNTVRCYLEALRFWISAMTHMDKRVGLKSQAWYWYGRGCHRLRVVFSPQLRRHVFSDSYM